MDTQEGYSGMTVNELRAYLEQVVAVESNLLNLRSACETLEVHSLCYKVIGTKADYSISYINDSDLIQHISDYRHWLNYNAPFLMDEVGEKCLESYPDFFAFSEQEPIEIFHDISSLDSNAKDELFKENYQAPTVAKETIPAIEVVHEPIKVKEVQPVSTGEMLKLSLRLGVFLWGFFELMMLFTESHLVSPLLVAVASFLICFLVIFFVTRATKDDAQRYSEYLEQKRAYDSYVHRKERLESEWLSATKSSFNSAYRQALSKASEAYEKFANMRNQTIEEEIANLKKSIAESESVLQKLYDMNVLYPKYQTFTAASTILEYFETGRCTELTGPDGAYNLYESELRQNLIIMKLDEVIHKLDELKSTMYMCCRAIENTSKQLRSLQRELETLNNTASKQLEVQQQSLRLNALSLMYTAATAANTEAIKYLYLLK